MQQPTSSEKTFDTKDVPLVAYLITCNPPFHIISMWQGVDSMDRPCTYFSLSDTEPLRTEVKRYYDGDALVDPREFWGNTKQVRKWMRIHTNGEGRGPEKGYTDLYKGM